MSPPRPGAAVRGVQGRIGVHRAELGCAEQRWGAQLEGAIRLLTGTTERFLPHQQWQEV